MTMYADNTEETFFLSAVVNTLTAEKDHKNPLVVKSYSLHSCDLGLHSCSACVL